MNNNDLSLEDRVKELEIFTKSLSRVILNVQRSLGKQLIGNEVVGQTRFDAIVKHLPNFDYDEVTTEVLKRLKQKQEVLNEMLPFIPPEKEETT